MGVKHSNLENKKKARDKLYELLMTRNIKDDNPSIIECFKLITYSDQVKILQIANDNTAGFLYKEICMNEILRLDEFWKLIRKKYNGFFTKRFPFIQQVSLSRKYSLH